MKQQADDTLAIRSADAEDFHALTALYQRSVAYNPQGFIQDLSFHGSLVERIPSWRAQGGDVVVAYRGGALVGLAALAPHDVARAELCKLHVDPDRQGQGIGRALCDTLIAGAHRSGFLAIELHVTVTQTRAMALYESLGFVPHRRTLFETVVFGEPVAFDTLHMCLPLSDSAAQIRQPSSRKPVFVSNS